MRNHLHIFLQKAVLAFFLGILFPVVSHAQIRIIPQEKIDSISNPKLDPISLSLAFEATEIDAGTIGEKNGAVTYLYPFRNISGQTIEIIRLVPNCACVNAFPTVRTVTPGQKGDIKVVYHPEGHPGRFLRTIRVYARQVSSSSRKSGTDEKAMQLAAFLKLKVKVKENETK